MNDIEHAKETLNMIKYEYISKLEALPPKTAEKSVLKTRLKELDLAIQALQEKAERDNPKALTLEQLKERVGNPVYDIGMSTWGIVGADLNIYYPASYEGRVSVIKHMPFPLIPSEFDNQRYYDHEPKETTND